MAGAQTILNIYWAQIHYQFWSKSWTGLKIICVFLKNKIWKKEVEEKEKKPKDIQLKLRKSSLKRFGEYKLCMLRPVIEINSKILTSLKSCKFVSVAGDVATEFMVLRPY